MWFVLGGLAAIGMFFTARRSGSPRETRVGAQFTAIRPDAICVTKGDLPPSGQVNTPTFRAVMLGTSGEAAAISFVYRGRFDNERALASGQIRRQIGLKLRAANGCNLVYVMWRLDPRPQLEVSIKINPGSRVHAECGARGYTKIEPSRLATLPALHAGDQHSIQAAIVGDDLIAWIDGQVAWRGRLPDEARSITGPAGIRSDNLAYDIVALHAAAGETGAELPGALQPMRTSRADSLYACCDMIRQ